MSGEINFDQQYTQNPLQQQLMQQQEQQQRRQQQQQQQQIKQKCRVTRAAAIEIDPENLDISFCGCGFLGIYHMGVVAAFKHYLPGSNRYNRICGCSAGHSASVNGSSPNTTGRTRLAAC